jgi:hypothetical protein
MEAAAKRRYILVEHWLGSIPGRINPQRGTGEMYSVSPCGNRRPSYTEAHAVGGIEPSRLLEFHSFLSSCDMCDICARNKFFVCSISHLHFALTICKI